MKSPRCATGEYGRKLMNVLPLVFGLVAYGWLATNRRARARRGMTETRRTLRFFAVPIVDVVPRVIEHGTAELAKVWRAISEVKGRVVHIHPRLASGALMNAGKELLRIEPSDHAIVRLQHWIEPILNRSEDD